MPLKPFKDSLERCPPKLPHPNSKEWENHISKKVSKYAWNITVWKPKNLLQRCPCKLPCPNPKKWESHVSKKAFKYACNTKVYKVKNLPQVCPKSEKFHPKSCPKSPWNGKSWNYFSKTCPNLFETSLKVEKSAHDDPKSALAFKLFKKIK